MRHCSFPLPLSIERLRATLREDEKAGRFWRTRDSPALLPNENITQHSAELRLVALSRQGIAISKVPDESHRHRHR